MKAAITSSRSGLVKVNTRALADGALDALPDGVLRRRSRSGRRSTTSRRLTEKAVAGRLLFGIARTLRGATCMRPVIRFIPAVAAVLVMTSCQALFGPGSQSPEPPLTELPRSLTTDELEVIEASNLFAFDILRETLRDQPADNILLSPLSASLALGMALNGARGETQEEMRNVLGFGGMPMERVNEAYRALIELLLGLDRGVDMRIANSIWAREGFPFHPSFYEVSKRYFDAEATTLDFSRPESSKIINAWVDRKTGGRITELVPDPIPPLVVMYLLNAIYFKADWTHQFDRSATRAAEFTLANGTRKPVQMMSRQRRTLHHFDPAGVQVVELPYARGAFAMTLLLPPAGTDIDTFIESLTEERWRGWLAGLVEGELSLQMPRFRLEYETPMNEPLITLGMELAFARRPGTDFTGLSPAGRDLFISRVFQKTFIEVNEEGTEAAAATMVEISRTSGPPAIVLNRPFVLAIRERLSGTLMFLGKIGDPDSR
jgi:serine protease inhibitor